MQKNPPCGILWKVKSDDEYHKMNFQREIMEKHCAETRFENGCSRLFVDGIEVPPVFYALTDLQAARCRTELAQRNVKLFSEAGIDLVQCDWNLRDGWTRENGFDPAEFLGNIEPVTRPGSKTRLVVRLHLNPPDWWMEEHPGEMTVFGVPAPFAEDDPKRIIANDHVVSRRVSLASEVWLRDAGKVLADFCMKLEHSERGGAVIGIQPACGMFGEWHWWAGGADPDHSVPQTNYFRRYLKELYGSVEALQAAWHDPHVTFENAGIPSTERRRAPVEQIFRDPAEYQAVIDCHKAQMRVPAEDIIFFCRIVKESFSRPVLAGAFYTYFFGCGKVVGGHLGADLVFKSPWVDYLGAPAVYGDPRLPGHSFVSRCLLESCRLNKKLFLCEMDQPPAGAVNTAPGGDPEQEHITVNLMRRNVFESFTRGHGLWYYDHRLMGPEVCKNFGWWETPSLIREIARQNGICLRRFEQPYRSEAEILCVWGTEVFYHTSGSDETAPPVSRDEFAVLEEISRCGVPHDHIYMEDLPLVDPSQYKVIIFQYIGMISPQDRELIRKKILAAGKNVIFVNNAGFSDGKTLSAENMKDLTGISMVHTGVHSSCTIGEEKATVCMPYIPLLRPDDPEAEVTAFFEDGAEAAGAVKECGNSKVWYLALPVLPSGFLRKLLKESGAHIYCSRDLVVKAGRNILCCHAPESGFYTITLKNGKVLERELECGETLLLDGELGEDLTARIWI